VTRTPLASEMGHRDLPNRDLSWRGLYSHERVTGPVARKLRYHLIGSISLLRKTSCITIVGFHLSANFPYLQETGTFLPTFERIPAPSRVIFVTNYQGQRRKGNSERLRKCSLVLSQVL